MNRDSECSSNRWLLACYAPAISEIELLGKIQNEALPFARHDDLGFQTDQLPRKRSYPIGVTAGPTEVHPHVAAIGPTKARKRLRQRRDARLDVQPMAILAKR
jgi:hypothetical protein